MELGGKPLCNRINQFFGVEVQLRLINTCSAYLSESYWQVEMQGMILIFGFGNILKIEGIIFYST